MDACNNLKRDYLELVFSAPTVNPRGKNEKEIFENLGNGQFSHTVGTVGVKLGNHKPRTTYRPIEEWDDFVNRKLARGYTIVRTQKPVILESKQVSEYEPLEDKEVEQLINFLRGDAKAAFDEDYTIQVEDITDDMIDRAKNILKELDDNCETYSVPAFNVKLRELYQTVPRLIKRYSDELLKTSSSKEDRVNKLQKEQDLLDFLVMQVKTARNGNCSLKNMNILEANGISEFRAATEEEFKLVKEMAGDMSNKVQRVWKVKNVKSEERFNKFCEKYGDSVEDNIRRLFHGTSTCNIWSITTNGLYLDDAKITAAGGSITGKMFGYGSYFSSYARKSAGYTSVANSYWKNGADDVGYMFVFKVATGEASGGVYDVYQEQLGTPDNWAGLQAIKPGADCLWARASGDCAASTLRNNELIVYREEQSSVDFLVEFTR